MNILGRLSQWLSVGDFWIGKSFLIQKGFSTPSPSKSYKWSTSLGDWLSWSSQVCVGYGGQSQSSSLILAFSCLSRKCPCQQHLQCLPLAMLHLPRKLNNEGWVSGLIDYLVACFEDLLRSGHSMKALTPGLWIRRPGTKCQFCYFLAFWPWTNRTASWIWQILPCSGTVAHPVFP